MTAPKFEKENRGEETIKALNRLLQSADLYDANNNALVACTQVFSKILQAWWQEDDCLSIKISRGRFFLQDTSLKFKRQNSNVIQGLLRYFEQRHIQELCLHSNAKSCSHQALHVLAKLLNQAEKTGNPSEWLKEQFNHPQFEWVELFAAKDQEEKRDSERVELAKRTYTYALASIQEVAQKITSKRRPGIRKVKRIAQNMVDLLVEDSSVMLGLSTIRDFDDYTYVHSVNVALLCLCLGKELGLPRSALCNLGICGLVHDLGKVEIPKEILNKPGQLTSKEYERMKSHPLRSVMQIIQLYASPGMKTKLILSPLEHHMRYDQSGYPEIPRKKDISLFGRIVTIADVFDALTSPRVYTPDPMSPDRALAFMVERSGTYFDPIILKVFVNMLGVYPVGTLLVLDTGEKAIVRESPDANPKNRPDVVVLESHDSGELTRGETVSLAEQDENGNYKRNVTKTLHPSTLNIHPAEYIL